MVAMIPMTATTVMASKRHPQRGLPSLVIPTCRQKSRSTHGALHRAQPPRGLALPALLPLLLLLLSIVAASLLLPVTSAAENSISGTGARKATRSGAWKWLGAWKGIGKGKGRGPDKGKGTGKGSSGSGTGSRTGTGADSGAGGGSGTGSGSDLGKSDGSGEIIHGGRSGTGNGTGSEGQSTGGGGSNSGGGAAGSGGQALGGGAGYSLTVEQQATLAEVNKVLGFFNERKFTGAAMGISRSDGNTPQPFTQEEPNKQPAPYHQG